MQVLVFVKFHFFFFLTPSLRQTLGTSIHYEFKNCSEVTFIHMPNLVYMISLPIYAI